ncbi:N-acetylglucosamine-6-phosphate deacetylase [Clostridium felsineum]|uniref:N-acetylglucosamine-6-phosphate deacetylase n=1 Tax=Clostridium felsineum TaxID=36839 RepID=A0A1S8MAG6_9CLOT|nr:N-acetylglucosamine-6-phosphate deacetylase [Clostridium felsineum]URZ08833.1 N-acetylglucosamine-6-phosphate deacetylase [Clostridium felsineum]URZ09461.1 N-acetylglucosamine-6-phosphate deacetylase [Clostridium felsineum]
MKAIINGKIITSNNVLENKILLFNETIEEIIDKNKFNYGQNSNIEIIDAKENYVSPGFIDVHIHGSGGCDTMDAEVEALHRISEVIVKNGVTSFLPTTMTMSKEKIYKALDNVQQCMKLKWKGSRILGTHLEGPFISEKYKGAQKEDFIIKPEYDFIEKYKEIIKIITLAPEKDLNLNFVREIKEKTNINLSIGHSDATYEEAMEAIDAGLDSATHLFNAMSPLHHRKPGIISAVFNSDIYCELIADTIHINPAIYQILVRIKGLDKLILITDSMRAGCLKDGVSELGGQKVIVQNNSARLEDGTLAGSILTLNRAVRNFKEHTDIKIYEAVNMASLNPAKYLKIDDKTGSIEIGKTADITIFDDAFDIKRTIINGQTAYEK